MKEIFILIENKESLKSLSAGAVCNSISFSALYRRQTRVSLACVCVEPKLALDTTLVFIRNLIENVVATKQSALQTGSLDTFSNLRSYFRLLVSLFLVLTVISCFCKRFSSLQINYTCLLAIHINVAVPHMKPERLHHLHYLLHQFKFRRWWKNFQNSWTKTKSDLKFWVNYVFKSSCDAYMLLNKKNRSLKP